MRIIYTTSTFILSLVIETFKWLTKGVYRIFRNATRDAISTWKNHRPVNKKSSSSNESLKRPIFQEAYDPNKKRHRRGHRGGRKHKRHHNH